MKRQAKESIASNGQLLFHKQKTRSCFQERVDYESFKLGFLAAERHQASGTNASQSEDGRFRNGDNEAVEKSAGPTNLTEITNG